MTKQYFYTDPLAAAWMAKHFGIKFTYTSKDGVDGEIGPRCLIECMEWYDRKVERFYIHPDSLHLLDPAIGDILRLYFYSDDEPANNSAAMRGFYAGGREALTWFRDPKDGSIQKEVNKIDDHQWRIVQRNGIPFMWPEVEEV